jgi:hypothetical protein
MAGMTGGDHLSAAASAGEEAVGWWWRVGPARPKARDAADWAGEKELGRGLLGYCWANCCAGLKRKRT